MADDTGSEDKMADDTKPEEQDLLLEWDEMADYRWRRMGWKGRQQSRLKKIRAECRLFKIEKKRTSRDVYARDRS